MGEGGRCGVYDHCVALEELEDVASTALRAMRWCGVRMVAIHLAIPRGYLVRVQIVDRGWCVLRRRVIAH